MAYNAAIAGGLKARIVYGTTTTYELTNPSGVSVVVPVTGVDAGGTAYGGQAISTISLAPGQTTTVSNGVTPPPAPQADLSISLLAGTTAPPAGSTMTFSLVISNGGPAPVTGASFANTLPAGLGTITNVTSALSGGASVASLSNTGSALGGSVNLPAGGKVTVNYQVQVALSATGNITNVATVNAPVGTTDPSPANNTASASVVVAGLADVGTTLQLPVGAPAGSVISGTVTFTNSATGGVATGVSGTVTLSNGDVRAFTLGNLAPGASSVKTFTTTLPATPGPATLNATSVVTTASHRGQHGEQHRHGVNRRAVCRCDDHGDAARHEEGQQKLHGERDLQEHRHGCCGLDGHGRHRYGDLVHWRRAQLQRYGQSGARCQCGEKLQRHSAGHCRHDCDGHQQSRHHSGGEQYREQQRHGVDAGGALM